MGAPRHAVQLATASALAVALAVALVLARDADGPGRRAPTTSKPTTTTAPATPTSTPTTLPPGSTEAPTTTVTTTAVTTDPAVPIRRGDTDRMVVALTFDAGSDAGHASEILDVLAAQSVPATFGLTGRWADGNPTLVRRIVAEGHQVVNHSYDHPSFTGYSTGAPALPRAERLDQLARADAAIRAAGGVSTVPWFRPPYGDEDGSVRADVGSVGYRYELLWTVDSLGWKGLAAGDVLRRCLDGAEPGAIYLMHVGAGSTDHAALPDLIDGLRARGYGFTTAAGLVAG